MSAAIAGAAKAHKATALSRSFFIEIPQSRRLATSTNNLASIWLLRGKAKGVMSQL
jgi:hypothetical protein